MLVALARAATAPCRRVRRLCTVSFYETALEPVESPRIASACRHLALLCLVLSLPTSLVFFGRCCPLLWSLSAPELLDGAATLFPHGLELALDPKGTLLLRPDPNAPAEDREEHAGDEGPNSHEGRNSDERLHSGESERLHSGESSSPDERSTGSAPRYVCWESTKDDVHWCAELSGEPESQGPESQGPESHQGPESQGPESGQQRLVPIRLEMSTLLSLAFYESLPWPVGLPPAKLVSLVLLLLGRSELPDEAFFFCTH